MVEILCSPIVVAGGLLSLYQGYRGYMFQWVRVDEPLGQWSKPRKFFLLALADGITYFLSSATGVLALAFAWRLLASTSDSSDLDLGRAALIAFLALYGLMGVTGKLPHLIDRGKLSPPGLGPSD